MAGGLGVSERVALTTIEEWSKKVSDLVIRRLILLAMMQKKGRIKTGCSGGGFRWPVRVKEHKLFGFPDAVPLEIGTRHNTKENAYLGWRGYYTNDTITLREKLENGGPEAMINVFDSRESLMREAAIKGLAAEFFVDGNATAQVAREAFHGIESFMGIGAQTGSSIIASTHDDSYAGLSTAVSALGTDTESQRVWTPTIINTNHTPTGGQQLWADYADQYLREINLRMTFGQGSGDKPDICMLTRDDYKSLLNLLDDKERITVARGSSMDLVKLGFGDHVEIDGLPVTWDVAVPSTDSDSVTVRGYVLTTDRMELKVLGPASQKQLFKSRVTFNDSYQADHIFLYLLGNLKFESPKFFGKLADISGVSS